MAIKKTAPKKRAVKKTAVKTVSKPNVKAMQKNDVVHEQHFNAWSFSIYIYWFIILFFISATFYILGRSHGLINPMDKTGLQVAEETLKSSNDYAISGKQKLLNGQIDDAILDLNVALSVASPSSEAYLMRAEAYMQLGDYKNAMSDLSNAIVIDKNNAKAFYDRALLKIRLEDFSGALVDINGALAAVAMNPESDMSLRDVYAKRGQLNLWLKNWQGAVSDYTNSLSKTTGSIDSSVYAERAQAYTALGQYDKAISDYTTAVRIIAEQVQGIKDQQQIESLSVNAMGYFERSAALNVRVSNIDGAKQDLQSAYAIAISLNDTDAANRLQSILSSLK